MDSQKQALCKPPPAGWRLSASLAHEINNPLEALLNLLYLVEGEAILSEKGRGYLKLAREEIKRISELTHLTLDRCHDTIRPQYANVPELLDTVVELYRSRIESRGIALKTRFCPNGNLAVYPQQLRQVFSNLLLNAADAVPDGGKIQARVSNAHEWTGQGRRGLRVTFADNGIGIPADRLRRIFQPFFTTKGTGGTGMGLSVVRDTVKQHGGVLRVRSTTRAGHSGSVFSIFLPAAKA